MKRSLGLDILRGIAVILVLFRHASVADPNLSNPVLVFLERGGWMGVDLFFVLSGFLVAGILFKEYRQHQRVNIGRFLIRRGMKIYPSFYFMLFAIVFTIPANTRPDTASIIYETLYLQNYYSGIFFHTWSLAVEEHFYLLLGILFLALLQVRKSAPFLIIPTIYLILLISCLTMRLTTDPGLGFFTSHLSPTHLRIDSLMCGVTVSYFYHFYREKFLEIAQRLKLPAFLLGIVFLSLPFFLKISESFFMITVGFTLLQLGAASILIFTLTTKAPVNIMTKTIALIGLHSYSIYLWHGPVAIIAGNMLPELAAPIYLAVSVIFGLLFGIAFEIPFLKIRDRLFPSVT